MIAGFFEGRCRKVPALSFLPRLCLLTPILVISFPMSGEARARKRVLITGVAGFVGSNLAKRLLQESAYEVVGIDNLVQGTLANLPRGIEFHRLDIRSKEIASLFSGVDCVFHLAAISSLFDCHRNPQEAFAVNAVGTGNVLEAARVAGVRQFVYADTSANYEGIRELPSNVDRVAPLSVYARSKRAGAQICESYRAFHGMRIAILRYFNVYGPAQDWRRIVPPVMSSFILKMLAGERPTIFGNGSKKRDFVFIDDVNDFHALVMREERVGAGTWNLGSGSNVSVLEVFERIAAQLHWKGRPAFEPDLPGEAQETLAEISASLELGWRPKIGLEEGISRSIAYLRSVQQQGPVSSSSREAPMADSTAR